MMSAIALPTLWGISCFVGLGYALSRILRRNDIADGMWGLGFLCVAAFQVAASIEALAYFRVKWVLVLITCWALRLSIYLWIRLLGKDEDKRYAAWRREWKGTEPWRAFLQVFLLQGILMGLISLPISLVIRGPDGPAGGFTFLGTAVFLAGFILESVADGQMSAFKKDRANQGRLMTTGLWSLCRHPNYLGEMLVWWGIFLIALETPGIPAVVVASPLLITYLLVRVSGVPMLDRLLGARAGFQKYAASVPALVPGGVGALIRFFAIAALLAGLDALWLNGLMRRFYLEQSAPIARLQGGEWQFVPWAAFAVYLFLAAAVQFAIRGTASRWDAAGRGAFLGLVIYGVYEATNVALVRSWPVEMAIVDLAWGPVLCGVIAALVRIRRPDR